MEIKKKVNHSTWSVLLAIIFYGALGSKKWSTVRSLAF